MFRNGVEFEFVSSAYTAHHYALRGHEIDHTHRAREVSGDWGGGFTLMTAAETSGAELITPFGPRAFGVGYGLPRDGRNARTSSITRDVV